MNLCKHFIDFAIRINGDHFTVLIIINLIFTIAII